MTCETDFRLYESEFFYSPGDGLYPYQPRINSMAVLSPDITVLFGNATESTLADPPALRILNTTGDTHIQENTAEAPQNEFFFDYHNFRAACRVTDTRLAIAYERYDNVVPGDPVEYDHFLVVVLCDVDPNTYAVTFHGYGVISDLVLNPEDRDYSDLTVTLIDSNKLLFTFVTNDHNLKTFVGTISGNSVSVSAENIAVDNVRHFLEDDRTSIRVVGLGNGLWAASFYAGTTTGANIGDPDEFRYGVYLVTGNASNNTDFLSLNPPGDYISQTWLRANPVDIAPLQTSTALITYMYELFDDHESPEFIGDSGWEQITCLARVITVSVSGSITSTGVQTVIYESSIDVGFQNGDVLYLHAMDSFSNNYLLVSGTIQAFEDYDNVYNYERLLILAVDGTDVTITTYCDVAIPAGLNFGFERTIVHLGDEEFLYVRPWPETTFYVGISKMYLSDIGACCEIYTSVLLLGVSVAANIAYVTVFADDVLALNVVDIALGQQIDSIYLCDATFPQVLAKTAVAFPLAISDSSVYVYGRMMTPQGIAHIMYSDDYGSNFSIIENSWLMDHAGSMVYTGGNNFLAMRCNDTTSKLYHNAGSGTALLSTLPFEGPTAVHGLRLSPFDDALLAAVLKDGESQTVLYSLPPYLSWEDITWNHPQTTVTAIVPL